jgi:hypothetical protein
MTDLKHLLTGSHLRHNLSRFFDGVGHRLFPVNRSAALQGCQHMFRMQTKRCGHHDCIEILSIEKRTVVGILGNFVSAYLAELLKS